MLNYKMITVIGSGYVGLVAAACLSQKHTITCLDINEKKTELLSDGTVPIYEPGLEVLIKNSISNNTLAFTSSYEKALLESSMAIIAVDTPTGSDGKCDLSNVIACAISIGKTIDHAIPIVIKSTVPVGTATIVSSTINDILEKRGLSFSIDVTSNPEFLREGSAVQDFLYPDRIILGVPNKRAEKTVLELYAPFNHDPKTFVIMSPESSELTKYASNTMLACRISYMNWLSQLCEKTGATIDSVRDGLGSDPRIGPSFLQAGMGFGGSCFPKDVKALISIAQQNGLSTDLIQAIDDINDRQKSHLFTKISSYFEERGSLFHKQIAILGLAFKPGTDDMREAPSLVLIKKLIEKGATLRLYDPVAMNNARNALPDSSQLVWCSSEWEAVENTDGLVLITEWEQFVQLDFKKVLHSMKGCAFFDGRNQFAPEKMGSLGFDYISIGRKPCYGSIHILDKSLSAQTVVFS